MLRKPPKRLYNSSCIVKRTHKSFSLPCVCNSIVKMIAHISNLSSCVPPLHRVPTAPWCQTESIISFDHLKCGLQPFVCVLPLINCALLIAALRWVLLRPIVRAFSRMKMDTRFSMCTMERKGVCFEKKFCNPIYMTRAR